MQNQNLTIIERSRRPQQLGELMQYRELLFFLVWRDLRVRYRQTTIGVLWAFVRPAVTVVVFSVLFARMTEIPSDNIPYPLFVLLGLLPWYYFSTALSDAATSIVNEQRVISKVYFPRLCIPLAKVVGGLPDFALNLLLLFMLGFYYEVHLTLRLFLAPLGFVLLLLNTAGFALWCAALNTRFRDLQHALPFAIQIGMFISPIIYSTTLLNPQYEPLLALNPLTGVIELARAIAASELPINWLFVWTSGVIGVAALVSGLSYFSRVESQFADIV